MPRRFFWYFLAAIVGLTLGARVEFLVHPTNQPQPIDGTYARHHEPTDEHKTTKTWIETFSTLWDKTWDDPVAFYTLILGFFTALLALVAGGQIYFLISADKTARITANAAKDTADAAIRVERPFLYISSIGLIISETFPSIDYAISNFGRTPAVLQRSETVIRCLTELPVLSANNYPREWRDRVIFAREEIPKLISWMPDEDKPNYELMRKGSSSMSLYFLGRMQYNDVFGKARETGFAYIVEWRGLAGHAFNKCGGRKYNYDKEIGGED